MKYEPYNFDSLKKLVAQAYNDGGYSGRKKLLDIVIEGEFEGFSGRATEGWEKRVRVQFGDKTVYGETIEDACSKLTN